jgi:hypothetical protein
MLDTLRSLIALQALDSAADAARKRIAEMPAAERLLDQQIARAKAVVDAVAARIHEAEQQRRGLEKETATLDGRMAQFKSHQAAVKTNQEYQALIHEIEVAQQTKAGLDDQVLALLTTVDDLNAERRPRPRHSSPPRRLTPIPSARPSGRRRLRSRPNWRGWPANARQQHPLFPPPCSPSTTRLRRTARAWPSQRWWEDSAVCVTSACVRTSSNRCAAWIRSCSATVVSASSTGSRRLRPLRLKAPDAGFQLRAN